MVRYSRIPLVFIFMTILLLSGSTNSVQPCYTANHTSFSASANQVAWLSNFEHRKSHVIQSSSGAGLNYSIRIVVHYGLGTDSGENVYCNTDCQSDFSDIRFTLDDGLTYLTYWLQEKSNGNYAIFWVKILDNLDSLDSTIYVYYGAEGISSESDGEATFSFFDDFSDSNLDLTKWNATVGVENTDFIVTEGELRIEPSTAEVYIFSNLDFSPGVAYYARVYFDNYRVSGFHEKNPATGYSVWSMTEDGASWRTLPYERVNIENEGDNGNKPDIPQMENQWQVHTIHWYSANHLEVKIDDIEKYDTTSSIPDGEPEIPVHFFCSDGDLNSYLYIDWIFVRKLVENEPSHGVWGSQEDRPSFLENWDYRKSHTILGSDGAGIGYQIRIRVQYGTGIDNGERVYCNLKCQTDFDDIRFTSSDGITLLPYWKEQYTGGNYAIFWVCIADNLDTDTTIYIYYGNQNALDESSGTDTFLLFDDFSSTMSSSLWDWDGASISDNNLVINSGNHFLKSDELFGPNTAIEARTQMGGNRRFNQGFGDEVPFWDDSNLVISHSADGQIHIFFTNEGDYGLSLSYPLNTWTVLSLCRGEDYCELWKDRTNMLSATHSSIPDSDLYAGFNTWGTSDDELTVDWVFVRKWLDDEPTHDDWGIEEDRTIPTSSTTTSTTETSGTTTTTSNTTVIIPPPPIDGSLVMLIGISIGGVVALVVVVIACMKSKIASGYAGYDYG